MIDAAPDCVIDIGSNTLRMLVARRLPGGELATHCCRQRTTRLAAGLATGNRLTEERMALTVRLLADFLEEATNQGVGRRLLLATEAVRRAKNGGRFVRTVQEATGLQVQVLEPEREAWLSCRGTLSALKPMPERALIFDLGGGSLEIGLAVHSRLVRYASLPVGVVRLAEAGTARPVSLGRLLDPALAETGIPDLVRSSDWQLVGTAGTVTTLAAMHLGLAEYSPDCINGLWLTRDRLLALKRRLAPLTPAQRETLPGMEEGRGDLILPGLEVVLRLMTLLARTKLRVSARSLLEGAVLHSEMFR